MAKRKRKRTKYTKGGKATSFNTIEALTSVNNVSEVRVTRHTPNRTITGSISRQPKPFGAVGKHENVFKLESSWRF
tara:strand:- start:1185 stop:1412 length:228 start_codon:yes stop_codon:yes gene_type:complete